MMHRHDKDAMRQREHLVQHLREKGIHHEEVLQAILEVPRHCFLDEEAFDEAYCDEAQSIGYGQTISQPYVVALMTEALLEHQRPQTVLEIGTGSGYQTAILSRLVPQVFSIERIPQLHRKATQVLRDLDYRNIETRVGDGGEGWESQAPYEAIMVTAAASALPEALHGQLQMGGCLIIPEGPADEIQMLVRYVRAPKDLEREEMVAVRFVPLVQEVA